MNFEKREINPARLCAGLANIGYKAHAAIEDIIDNSVTAGATEINILIDVDESKTLLEKGNIEKVRIIDNGVGMDNATIRTALDIGSLVSYTDNSLSKYGLGLKSAGLALGNRIEVCSKCLSSKLSDALVLDMDIIQERNEYGVNVIQPSGEANEILNNYGSGTVVEISKITNKDSANSLKSKLIDRLGVIYYEFICNPKINLSINVIVRNKTIPVEARDIMFFDESEHSFDEFEYDCKTPYKSVYQKEITLPNTRDTTPPITLSVCIFPQASMATYAGFTDQERQKIKSYSVSQTNSGFFIYRNNRLIRWGDSLGIIDRDLRTFRGRIDISTAHDEILNVDVSKQNLDLPEEFLDQLSLVCRIPKECAQKAHKKCKLMLEGNDDKEGESASESVIHLGEEDPSTFFGIGDTTESNERRKKLLEDSQKSQPQQEDSPPSNNSTEKDSQVKKIVYKDSIESTNLWSYQVNAEYGTILYINRSHPFYQLVLRGLPAADSERQALECFIYCLAVGEIKTIENLASVDMEEIKMVFSKFNQIASWNLQNWTAHNQDLFD
ncbi:ATP-binding protein [Teredinibacter turnerae]|uniref:ATP-binding protein n=1 Tax=Teredinibacter turnerae TaxID=2426 RepID=UPI00041D72D4|nr:ATP-binding protein [Teredinibacter turnerae]